MIVPRHPERFGEVAALIESSGFSFVYRTDHPLDDPEEPADVIMLDTIGELRAALPLAEIVFVGGSLIPHGGQSVFEPAAAGKAIVTGPHTMNFDAAVKEFLAKDALVQIDVGGEDAISPLAAEFSRLLANADERNKLGSNALGVMQNNRGAVTRTMGYLKSYF